MMAHIAGDEVIVGNSDLLDNPNDRYGSFRFRHEMNVEEVTATFLHEDGEHVIEVFGTPEAEASGQPISTASGPRYIRYGKVQLRGHVEGEDPPGEYTCTEIRAHTAGGEDIPFEDVPKLSFLVVREPTRPPHLAGAITLGPQRDIFHDGGYDETRDEFVRPDRPE